MRRKPVNLCAAASACLCVATAVLWIATDARTWKDPGVPLAGRIQANAFDGWMAIYNQSTPFFDGTVSISSATGSPPKWPREVHLRFPGFHFRHFTWPGEWPGGTYWTFALSPLYLVILTASPPAIWIALAFRRRRRTSAGRCTHCSYNLTANASGICPECGTAVLQARRISGCAGDPAAPP